MNDPWKLYQSRGFADLWYDARSRGERLRAHALERLYRDRPYPGGPHPDPREPSAFSSKGVLSVAATIAGLEIDAGDAGAFNAFNPTSAFNAFRGSGGPIPHHGPSVGPTQPIQPIQPRHRRRYGFRASRESHGSHGSRVESHTGWDEWADYDEETGRRLPDAWIMTYPRAVFQPGGQAGMQSQPHRSGNDEPRPQIIVRSLHTDSHLVEFAIACLIGYWHYDYTRLADPDAPAGIILLPHDPSITTILHQYAIALLCLPRDCPASWSCHCNAIRRRFNAPPPDHTQPTGQLTADELAEEAQRQRRATEPRFPYVDKNAWTEE